MIIFLILDTIYLVCFNTYQLLVFYPREGPLGALMDPKTNYMLDLSKFSTTLPILDHLMTFDRTRRDLKLCLRG